MPVTMRVWAYLVVVGLTACGPQLGDDAPRWMIGTFSSYPPGGATDHLTWWEIKHDGTILKTYVSHCGDYSRLGGEYRWKAAGEHEIDVLDMDGRPYENGGGGAYDRFVLRPHEGDSCTDIRAHYMQTGESTSMLALWRGKTCLSKDETPCPSGYQCDDCFSVLCDDEGDEEAYSCE
jgi:hypothetical protein